MAVRVWHFVGRCQVACHLDSDGRLDNSFFFPFPFSKAMHRSRKPSPWRVGVGTSFSSISARVHFKALPSLRRLDINPTTAHHPDFSAHPIVRLTDRSIEIRARPSRRWLGMARRLSGEGVYVANGRLLPRSTQVRSSPVTRPGIIYHPSSAKYGGMLLPSSPLPSPTC